MVVSLVFGPLLGPLGMIGAMTGTVARDAPLRRRVVTLLVCGIVMLGCAWVGMATGNRVGLLVPAMTVLTVVIVWFWHAVRAGPPGPINLLFAAAYGGHLASAGYPTGTVLRLTALAWAVASAVSVLVFCLDVHAPEREAVDEAETAVSSYRDRSAEDDEKDLRGEAFVALEDAWDAMHGNRMPVLRRRPESLELRERLTRIHLEFIELLHAEAFPASPLDIGDNFDDVPEQRPSVRYLVRTALDRGSVPWLAAQRAGFAVLLASAAMVASPVGRPYWAILSALIMLHLQASRSDLAIRGVHRVFGTVLGLGVYFGLVQLDLPVWGRLTVVIVAVYGMNCLAARNYALGVVFITVYALMMVPITPDESVTMLMTERLVETVMGVLAALVSVAVVGRRAPVLLVRGQYRRTLHAIEAVLLREATGRLHSPSAVDDRRNLVFELERAGEVLSSQRSDEPGLKRWDDVQQAVNRFGFDVVAASWRHLPQGEAAAAHARQDLSRLIAGLPPISTRDIDQEDLTRRIDELHHAYLTGAAASPASAMQGKT